MKTLLLLAGLVAFCTADTYMQSPRGSNNRLNEKSANRRNGNRAFDSQNNNRGGYNVGDRTTAAANNEAGQYQMSYFGSNADYKTKNGASSSYMTIEWTNQHGCGGNEDSDPNKLNCNMVLQFLCRPDTGTTAEKVRDGRNTNTPNYQNSRGERETQAQFEARKRNGINAGDRVLQEPFEWYDKCKQRKRNKGLFTADQNVRDNRGATATRQNPNGNRRGYECPEERDHYPYWHPSDWKDIAVLAENATMCKYYDEHNYNTQTKWECVQNFPNTQTMRHWSHHNNKAACEAAGGAWTEFTNFLEKDTSKTTEAACTAAGNVWGRAIYGTAKECLVPLPKPDCRASEWSRVNHLGNGKEGEALNYTWELPHFPSGQDQRCVLRLRYNISTDDYDPWNTDYKSNQNNAAGIQSPVTQNPTVEIGANNIPLQLAINTAQFGRTFQDRSHMFYIKKRPAGVTQRIFNLNVRGKRGNIVQTFPAVEYDFFPTNLKMKTDDLVHVQWTGSNTHNNGNPAGDGQAGDAGEGTGGTDRSNIMEVGTRNDNFPVPFESAKAKMFKGAKAVWMAEDCKAAAQMTETDIRLQFGSGGYFASTGNCGGRGLNQRGPINNLLNNVSPSYGGILLKMAAGEFHYICTRNNNFTNRSQKGSIIVT